MSRHRYPGWKSGLREGCRSTSTSPAPSQIGEDGGAGEDGDCGGEDGGEDGGVLHPARLQDLCYLIMMMFMTMMMIRLALCRKILRDHSRLTVCLSVPL